MFIPLFLLECKQLLKSITYYIVVACTVVFFVFEAGGSTVVKPEEGQESYGWKYSSDESVIMDSSLDKLLHEMAYNSFATYPVGFYKEVTLSDLELAAVAKELSNVTTDSSEDILYAVKFLKDTGELLDVSLKENVTYDEFCEVFDNISDVIGKGSNYEAEELYYNAHVQMTYEEALQKYNNIIEQDQISRALARLFSDYMGINLGIIPVFLAVTRALKDKRAKAKDVIYSKKGTSVTVILSRIVACCVMILIPVLICSINPLLQSIYAGSLSNTSVDLLAFIKVIFGWLLPIILFTVSLGFLFTEITNGPIAVLVGGGFWFISVFLSSGTLVGYVGMNLIPRFNALGEYQIFESIKQDLILNRLFYTGISLLMIIATIIVYDRKRKGRYISYGVVSKNRKNAL